MTIYEYMKQANKKQFCNFCFRLYNKGWSDGAKGEDDEEWIYHCLADLNMEEWEKVE